MDGCPGPPTPTDLLEMVSSTTMRSPCDEGRGAGSLRPVSGCSGRSSSPQLVEEAEAQVSFDEVLLVQERSSLPSVDQRGPTSVPPSVSF